MDTKHQTRDSVPESFARVRAAMAAFRPTETVAIAAARAYGLDIGLLKESILHTPVERVRRNDEILATIAATRAATHQSPPDCRSLPMREPSGTQRH